MFRENKIIEEIFFLDTDLKKVLQLLFNEVEVL